MSDTMPMPPLAETPVKQAPTVYFIDDSATMREVIKIAFRREHYNVITCADAASALAQFEQNRPDVVITDVIMPDQDGYSVCSHIKQHPDFSGTPVVLMSGVVNKSVADKAVSVQADELVRKPFQPQELINRVKALLEPKLLPGTQPTADRMASPSALSSLFAPAPPAHPRPAYLAHPPREVRPAAPPWPNALTDAFTPPPPAPSGPSATPGYSPGSNASGQSAVARPPAFSADVQKLRLEIARLDL